MSDSTFPCPGCGRTLHASGEVSIEGGPPLPVYQCDQCKDYFDFDGERFRCALTFAVDLDGNVLDAATLEPKESK